MPSVSVIVPVYRVEKYIERCLRCLFEQTLEDIEYVFIDDCTPDKSMEIVNSVLSEYPSRKNSVKIFRMPVNSGQARVREYGASVASGEYIIQCDSDDCLDRDYYETLYRYAKGYDLDIVAGSSYDERADAFSLNPFKRKKKAGRAETSFEMHTSSECDFVSKALLLKVPVSMWSLMVNRRIYDSDGFKFPPAAMGEDVAISLELYYFSKRVGFVSGPRYYYMFNPEGISQSQSEDDYLKRFEQACANTDFMESFLLEHYSDGSRHLKELDYFKCRHRNYILPLIGDRKYYDIWINKYKEINGRILFSGNIPVNLKLKYLTAVSGMFPKLRKLLRRVQKLDNNIN